MISLIAKNTFLSICFTYDFAVKYSKYIIPKQYESIKTSK